jgi:hypothetical protein
VLLFLEFSVRPIPSVFQKEKSLTWKHLSKIGRTKFSFAQPWNHDRRQSDGMFFFVKISFSPIKSPNSTRKSIWKSRNQYFILTSFIESKNTCLMILNDKPNCQVSRILMNPCSHSCRNAQRMTQKEHWLFLMIFVRVI